MTTFNKFERDGAVAVLVSPGFGAGWSTWNSDHRDAFCFDAELVAAVLDGNLAKAETLAEAKYPHCYVGGATDLEVRWVTKGKAFEIREYDGSESLVIVGDVDYQVA